MTIEEQLRNTVIEAVEKLYGEKVDEKTVQVQLTRKDQNGDYTVVVFPLLRVSKKKPEETGADLGSLI